MVRFSKNFCFRHIIQPVTALFKISNFQAALDTLESRLLADFGVRPVVAAELEFYLVALDESGFREFAHHVGTSFHKRFGYVLLHEAERGLHQYEVAFRPGSAQQAIAEYQAWKGMAEKTAAKLGGSVSFAAKPTFDQPGSGLHIHLHLADESGANLFHKNEEQSSDALQFALGGLLAAMPESMLFFAPVEESYARLQDADHVARTVSWGANNRTAALRVPSNPFTSERHIEHRVCCADADFAQALAAILAAIHYGLGHDVMPPAQIYGDARLDSYELAKLPESLEEALEAAAAGTILRNYFPAA